MPAFYPLLGFLLVPSFQSSTLVTLDFFSLTVQSKHRFLQSFFMSEIEYGIDDGSLVLESLWFWYLFENFCANYLIIKSKNQKGMPLMTPQ